jgi:hypothetical protein
MADIDNTLPVTLIKCFSRQVFQQLPDGNLRFIFGAILKIKPTIGLLVFHAYQFAVIMRDFPVPVRDFHFQAVKFHFRLHGPYVFLIPTTSFDNPTVGCIARSWRITAGVDQMHAKLSSSPGVAANYANPYHGY